MTSNRLNEQVSPYLLLHADNPVHWQPWDDHALHLAEQTNKPILLSIGYNACHWCHVMAQESFSDPTTASVMNELFVNIKVDREERPDLDTIYQTALANMGHQRGWPLTMFLTPKGEPFAGGTYFPSQSYQDRPSFKEVMHVAAKTYKEHPEQAKENTAKLISALSYRKKSKGEISIELMNHAANQLLDGVDIVYGGLGLDAKFPQPMFQELLWRAYCRTSHHSYRNAVENTLDHMCNGGIYDHLGGGFARYTIDDRWLIPHFEKMLYDNALLVSLLTLVFQETKKPIYANCIKETANWLLTVMQTSEGGFASSLAADSAGYEDTDSGEGAYYIWREAEIDRLLGDDATFFKNYYDVSTVGNWEETNILNRIEKPFSDNNGIEIRLAKLKQKLQIARNLRPPPDRDDKILVDWNGLAIAALAEASLTFDCPEWLNAACNAYQCVMENISEGDILYHSYRHGQHTPVAVIDDYANMSHAAIRLFEVTSEPVYLKQAQAWVDVVNKRYWDKKEGGYFYTSDDVDSLVVRTKTASETSTPSGNGMMISVLARLYALTAVDKYRDLAEKTISTFSMEISSNYLGMATLINSSEMLQGLIQIVIVGNANEPQTQHLLNSVFDVSLPNRLLQIVSPNTTLPPSHPAKNKAQLNGKPTVYICRGTTCNLPLTDAIELKNMLKKEVLTHRNVSSKKSPEVAI